jgi:hypothetical protein
MFEKISSLFKKKKPKSKLQPGDKINLVTEDKLFIVKGRNKNRFGIIRPQDILTMTDQKDDHYFFFTVAKVALPYHLIKNKDIIRIPKKDLTISNHKKL